ncbi:MAG TPA: CarD family transcriptional regulator [Gemmatimonadaceae bacterium]|nr:CarD family transcriptional regulator [Gemmatimonadaceae bacterium]
MTFQVGDKVIYPNHGLGIVERIEEKTILGTTCGFFHLRIVANDTTVLVPVANVDGVGLRKAIDDAEVERLFTLIGDGKIDNHQNWKGRFKDNSDKMRTGSIYDMADVLKSLTFLSKSKSLSFREKRMLDRAKALIISEVSEVMRLKALEVEEQVDRALEKCFTTKVRNINRSQARAASAKVAAKPPVVAAPKAPVVNGAKPPVVAAAKPVVAPKPAVATAAKPVVATAKAVVSAKPVIAAKAVKAVPPLVARRAARAS